MPRRVMPEYDHEELPDFKGGWNTDLSGTLQKNELTTAKNLVLNLSGKPSPRPGMSKRFAANFSASPVLRMGQLQKSDGTARLLMAAGSSIWADTPHIIFDYDTQAEWETGSRYNVSTTATAGSVEVLLSATAPTPRFTTVIQPEPTAGIDAMVRAAYPDNNYGSDEQLTTGQTGTLSSTRHRSFIQFALGAYSGMTLESALLGLYCCAETDTSNRTVWLYRVTATWSEAGVTWNNQPAYSETNGHSEVITGINTWFTWDITAIVNLWLAGTANYGGIVYNAQDSVDNSAKYFWSSDYATDITLRPKLTLIGPYVEYVAGKFGQGALFGAGDTLKFPTATGAISVAVGTVELHINPDRAPGTTEQFIFDGAGAANRNLQALIMTTGVPAVRFGTGSATVEVAAAAPLGLVVDPVFARTSVAFDSNLTEIAVGLPRFEAGKFGQAVMVESGTTPVTGANTFLDTDTDANGIANAFAAYVTGAATGTRTMDATVKFSGRPASQKITRTGGAAADRWGVQSSALITGVVNPNRAAFLVNVTALQAGASVVLQALYYNSSDVLVQTKSVTISAVTGGWARKDLDPSSDATAVKQKLYAWIEGGTGTLYIQAIQTENNSYGTSFTNVTRQPSLLKFATAGVLSPTAGTWEQWVYVDAKVRTPVSGIYKCIFYVARTVVVGNSHGIWLFHRPDTQQWQLQSINDANEPTSLLFADDCTPDGWHLFSVKWSATELKVFVGGVLKGSAVNPKLPSGFQTYAYIGSQPVGHQLNTVHDEIRISSTAHTDGKIIADAALGTPFPQESDTTYLLRFDSDLRASIWVGVAWRWSSAGVALLINGVQKAASATAPDLVFGADAYLGTKADGTCPLDGLLDEVRVAAVARTDVEIKAGYDLLEPYTWDIYTSYLLHLDGNLSLPVARQGNWLGPVQDASAAEDTSSLRLSWVANIPATTALSCQVRTSANGSSWSAWYEQVNGELATAPANDYSQARFVFQTADGVSTPRLDSCVVSYEGTPTATEIASGLGVAETYGFTQLADEALAVSAAMRPRKYDGATVTTINAGPYASSCGVYMNRAFAALGNTLYFSDLLSLDTWPVENYMVVNPADGDRIVALVQTPGMPVIAKERSVYYLEGYSPATFSVSPAGSFGTISPQGMIWTPYGYAALDREGVWLTDLKKRELLTRTIQARWLLLNQRTLHRAALFLYGDLLLAAAPGAGSSTCNTLFVFDIRHRVWVGEWTGWKPGCFLAFYERGQWIYLFGDASTGNAYQIGGQPTDAGTAFTSELETAHLSLAGRDVEKRLKWLDLDLATGAAAATLGIAFVADGVAGTEAQVTVPASQEGRLLRFYPPAYVRTVGIRGRFINTSSDGPTLLGMNLTYFPRGQRPQVVP